MSLYATRNALLALSLTFPSTLLAQNPASSDTAVRAEIEELKARIARLENLLEDRETLSIQPQVGSYREAPAPIPQPMKNLTAARADNIIAAPADLALQDPKSRIAFELAGSTEGKRATLQLSNSLASTSFDGRSEGKGNWSNITISASAPLGDDGPTNIGTLSSLNEGFAFKVGFTSFKTALGRPDATTIALFQNEARNYCRVRNAGSPNLKKICDDADQTLPFLLKYLGEKRFNEYQRAFFPRNATWAWGLSAGLGYKEFKFLDPADGMSMNLTRLPLEGKVFTSWFPDGGRTSFTGSVSYQRAYKASKTGALCPTPSGAFTQCLVGALGPPNGKDEYILSAGMRSFLPLRGYIIPGIGISPSFNFDAKSDEFGIDLPIYLVPDKDGNLTGGLRVGYGSADDEVVFGVFVGSNFSLTN